MIVDDGGPTLTSCTFTSNSAEVVGGGMYTLSINCIPRLINCTFSGNYAGFSGGGIFNNSSSPMLKNCTFIGNVAGGYGGGMSDSGAGALTNCTFIRNSAIYGGAIDDYKGNTSLANCMFISNSADYGGVIFTGDSSEITLTNCTFAANSAILGNALACDGMSSWGPASSKLQFTNCILWNGGNEIWINDGSTILIMYSDVQGGETGIYDPCETVVWSDGNFDADPCFADVNNGDYHLRSQSGRWDANSGSWVQDDVTSPCIDAGNPGCPVGDEPEFNGNRRNMGAYGGTAEASKSPVNWRSVADFTNDWIVDYNDLKVFADYWLVLQRYKSSSKTMQPVDDTPVKDHFSGGYRHGRQNNYANQTGIDAIPAPV